MASHTENDVNWLAFRYAAGEMTADEQHRFEQRLADDQTAREAVEQAVELTAAVRLAAASTPAVRSRRPRTLLMHSPSARAAMMAVLLLAVGAAAWLGSRSIFAPPTDRTTTRSEEGEIETSEQDDSLALQWAAMRENRENAMNDAPFSGEDQNYAAWIDIADLDASPLNIGQLEAPGSRNGEEGFPPPFVGRDGRSAAGELPDWLLTAVADETDITPEAP